jgi:acetoin utilization deacetylase AcuC-like enzyme
MARGATIFQQMDVCMKTVFSPRHRGHANQLELVAGAIVPGFELTSRAEYIAARVAAVELGVIIEPTEHDLKTAARVHRQDYLDFLPTIWDRWTAEGRNGTALPFTWPTRGLRGDVLPEFIDGLLGYYSFDAGCGIVEGSWDAIKSSHDVALTAAGLVQSGERAAFALCRPPGHHAGAGFMGGYCYINNAAVAAQWLRDNGARRVSILDVDYHHGNGSQSIFYERSDVLFTSIHGHPEAEFPFFLGYADELGEGAGEGFNFNYPLPAGSGWDRWSAALEQACEEIERYGADIIVVSLGVDTFKDDPISQFKLDSPDYLAMGARIARLGKPTLFVMEGGYAVEEIGINAVNVLEGFEGFAQ